MRVQSGNFYVIALDVIPPKGLEGAVLDANMTRNDMVIPTKIKPEQSPPNDRATLKMQMKARTDVMNVLPLEFQLFHRKAVSA